MVQKIRPRVVIWVPSSTPPVVLLGPSKQPMRRPSIKKSVTYVRSNILITLFLFNEIYCRSTPAATVYLSSSPLNQAHFVYFPNYRSSFHLCGLPLHYSTLEQETFSSLEISSSPLSPRIIWIYV